MGDSLVTYITTEVLQYGIKLELGGLTVIYALGLCLLIIFLV